MARAWSSTAKRGVGRRAIDGGHLVDQLRVARRRSPGRRPSAQPSRRNRRSDDALAAASTAAPPSRGPAAACPPGSAGGCRAARAGRPRSGQRSASSWAIIPPIDSPTTVGAVEAEVVDDAGGRRRRDRRSCTAAARGATSRCRGCRCARPGGRARASSTSRRRPHEPRRRPAVEEHDRRARPALVVVDRLRRPADDVGAAARGRRPRRGSRPRSVAATTGLRPSAITSTPDVGGPPRRRRRRGERQPRSAGPVGRSRPPSRQVAAPELAGRRAGQGVHERHRTRHLVPGEVLADVVLDLAPAVSVAPGARTTNALSR